MDGAAAAQRARLYWRCRRGMRELDLLLQGFLTREYDSLDAGQRRAFEALLACPDQHLADYLFGRSTPFDGEMARVARRIRDAAAP